MIHVPRTERRYIRSAKRRRYTHFIPYDAPGKLRRQALCGVTIDRRDHAEAPVCPDCQRLLAQESEP